VHINDWLKKTKQSGQERWKQKVTSRQRVYIDDRRRLNAAGARLVMFARLLLTVRWRAVIWIHAMKVDLLLTVVDVVVDVVVVVDAVVVDVIRRKDDWLAWRTSQPFNQSRLFQPTRPIRQTENSTRNPAVAREYRPYRVCPKVGVRLLLA